MLSFIMLSNPLKVNKKANLWFGIALFLWSTFWLDEILMLIKAEPLSELIRPIISFIQFFTPILFYLSIVFFTNPNHKFKAKDTTLFVLPIIYLVLVILNKTAHNNLQTYIIILVLTNTIIYIIKSYLKLRTHRRKITLFSSNTDDIDLKWLENIILVIVVMVVVISAFNLIYIGLPLNLYLNIIMLGTSLFIAYNALKQKEIFPINEKHREEVIAIENDEVTNNTIKRKILKDEELVELKSKLNLLMKEKHLYLDQDINLASLSEDMQITPHQLSYIINNGFNQNFFKFINSYRIDKAKILLLDKSLDKLTILGIAYESGFSSKTAFNTTFKKLTNQTPSEFKKQSSKL
ncbi:AraC family transcriptional regulator [Tamlana sp. 2201CG12-4]|uniref:helix-turn-helix domain-containing protein n=1 Tax=Tamlana sp. 2201CG12-4 TaxID=3112582 RepID=UPI002DB7DAB2|nr:AraC family transcriptional regulator [Tamlana sp. 2201CG12-4]MEC3908119.1 AraC family transcriptional regulator [Tamlana sp. 2201CG12-4]